MKFDLRLIRFLDEIGVCALLLALFLAAVLIGWKMVRHEKWNIILSVAFLAVTVLSELVLQQVQRRGWEFFLIAVEFLAVPACLGFGVSAVLGMVRGRKKKAA